MGKPESFWSRWKRGAKQHPGWGLAFFFSVMCWLAAASSKGGLDLSGAIGAGLGTALWFGLVICTCASVGEANPPDA